MTKFVQSGTVAGGRLELSHPDQYRSLVKAFEGEDVRITIQRKPKGVLPRSGRQNNYLWGVPYELIAEHTGYTTDEIHALMGSMFLRETVTVLGNVFEVTKSTTKLNTGEFSEYVEHIRAWAEDNLSGETRFRIPLPDETDYV